MRLVTLQTALRELGYTPSMGQLKVIGRELSKRGHKCQHVYDPILKGQRAHVDLDAVPERVLREIVEGLRALNVPVKETVPVLPPPPPTPRAAPPTLRSLVLQFADDVERTLRPAPLDIRSALVPLLDAHMRPLADEVRKLSGQVAAITGLLNTEVAPTQKPSLPDPPMPNVPSVVNFLLNLAECTGHADYIETANAVRQAFLPSTLRTDLPTTAVWKGERWVTLVYADTFWKDWDGLRNPEHKSTIRDMLRLLTQNPYHRSLNTHRLKDGVANPPGVPDHAVYSRASDNVRVYWSFEDQTEVMFYRIVVKAG